MLPMAALLVVVWAASYFLLGWRGWLVVGPLLVLLWFNPAWGTMFFLIVVAVILGGLLLWLVWKILPWAIFFVLGIWMVYMLVVGFGMLIGA